MSLMSYQETRPWAKAIRTAILSKRMPPWDADSQHGRFKNNPTLTDLEIKVLVYWIDNGAPEGSISPPPAPVFADGWRIGKPDLVIPIPEEHIVEPNSRDDYRIFINPTPIEHDLWIKAIELKPGNRRAVHHAHVFFIPPTAPAAAAPSLLAKYAYHESAAGPLRMRADAPVVDDSCRYLGQGGLPDMRPRGDSQTLTTFVPGRAPEVYPPGYARLIPAGSKIGFQIHYAAGAGATERDRTSVGLILADGPPQKIIRRLDLETFLFQIPPGAADHEVAFCYDFPDDARLLSLTPHMHLRGKDMKWELMRPDAIKETLLSVPHYDFNWQIEYQFLTPIEVPAGSSLIETAHYDNSANNPRNPDPSRTVRWGEPTADEMAGTWISYELAKEPR